MADKYRVHEIARFNYSDIGEYIDENHTDIPLRNDILVELLNALNDENEELKERIKKHMEIELLKSEDYANCHNCKHDESVHDGVALDGMCSIKGLMNIDGYFDVEYHRLPNGTICPYWELEE